MMDMNPTMRADWTRVMASTGTQPYSDSDTPLHSGRRGASRLKSEPGQIMLSGKSCLSKADCRSTGKEKWFPWGEPGQTSY